jgi:hypothetical protein
MGWYEDEMVKSKAKAAKQAAVSDLSKPKPKPAHVVTLEEALGETVRAKPEPKPVAPPKPDKQAKKLGLGVLPATDAWLIFRTVEGNDGRMLVENVRIARGLDLNKQDATRAKAARNGLEGEPRDWDYDIPLLDPGNPQETPQQAWMRFLLGWQFRPQELVDAMRAAATIEGLDYLHMQANLYEESHLLGACNLKKDDQGESDANFGN